LSLAIDRSALNPYHYLIEDSVAYSVFDEQTIEELRKVSDSEFEYMGDLYSLNPKKYYVDIDKVSQLLDDLDPTEIEDLSNIKSQQQKVLMILLLQNYYKIVGKNT